MHAGCVRCCSQGLTLVVGWQEGHKTECWDAGVVTCLGQGADLHMAQVMPLPLTISCSSKSRLVLPSWFYLSGAGQNPRGPQTVVCLCVRVCLLDRQADRDRHQTIALRLLLYTWYIASIIKDCFEGYKIWDKKICSNYLNLWWNQPICKNSRKKTLI